jgi:hypothetical protein
MTAAHHRPPQEFRVMPTPPALQPSRGLAAASVRGAWRPALALLLISAATVFIGIPRVQAATYKWTDEKGVVHYTDKIPPEALNKGNVELNKQGVTVRRTDPALTPEQRRAREIEEERARQLAKEREIIERRDKALLSTYTMESEIDLARSRALNTIDAQIQSATSYSALLNKRKAELDARKAASGDKAVPAVIERELANINVTLQGQADLITTKQREMLVVGARYDADKKRWQELRAATEASMRGASNVMPATTTTAK